MPYFDGLMKARQEAKQARKLVAQLEPALVVALARLTDRQRRFCEICGGPPRWGSAYRAAAQAGYATPRSEGSRLVSMVKVGTTLKLQYELKGARQRLASAESNVDWWAKRQRNAVRQEVRAKAAFDAWVASRIPGDRLAGTITLLGRF